MRRHSGLWFFGVTLMLSIPAMAATISVDPGQSIQTAINNASPGDTILVAAGTYVENIVIDKRLHILGAGDGASGTIIQGNPLATNSKIILISSGGTSEAERLVIEGIRVTGGTASDPGGNNGSGIEIMTNVGHVLLRGVTSTGNDGHGIEYNTSGGDGSDVHLENCALVDNKGCGVRIPQSLGSLSGFSLRDSTIADNKGIGVLFYSEGATDILIANCVFARNNSNGATGGDLVLSGFTGDAVFEGLYFESQDADSIIRMSGTSNSDKTPKGPAGVVVFREIIITGTQAGTYPGAAIAISRYTDGSQISFENVVLASSGLFGLHLGTLGGSIDLGGVTFNGSYTMGDLYLGKHGQQDGSPNSYPASTVAVDASSATFIGLLDPFAIEDSIHHALDDSALGLVVWNPNNVYVTPSSGSIQRGVEAAAAGWTVNVAAGTYVENVDINGSLGLLGQGGAVLDGTGLGKTGINVDSGHVTVDGLEVRNYSDTILAYAGSDYVTDWTDIVVSNNTIHDATGATSHGFGVYAGTESERFWLPTPPWGMAGLDHLLDFTGLLIQGNEIYNTANAAIVLQSITATTGTLDVLDNSIHDAGGSGVWIDAASNIRVAGNDILDCGTGIFISAYSDGYYEGVANQPFDSRDVQILYNIIAGNTPYGGVAIYDGFPATINIHYNVIEGNSIGVNNWVGGGDVNASLNWWGTADGPSGQGAGGGDAVSSQVIFSPWLSINPDGNPALPGVQITEPMTIVVAPVGPEPTGGYLNMAITGSNMVPGVGAHTIGVREGTYDASQPITNPVNLFNEGESAANTILNGAMALEAGNVLLGRLGQGFTINGPITVGAGVDASTIHINWNDIFDVVSNLGLHTLDATFNYWGEDGPDTVGKVAIFPMLPDSSDIIIGYMTDLGLSALNAIDFANLLAQYLSEREALVVIELMNTFGFSEDEANTVLDQYGYVVVDTALTFSGGDYNSFLVHLLGYLVDAPIGGGGAEGEIEVYVTGDLVSLTLALINPITGEVADDALVSYTVCRTLADGTPEIAGFGVMSFDADQGTYVYDIDTTGFAPGVYDIFLGPNDGRCYHFQIELVEG